ncbi:MAG: Rho termination factor N-terminal domain-containing protein, partial [Flavobacteriaceae bacterium]|nr:Rho termination factor N-terminal domain-containing protein [Flavobacteriaceae bacterium]
MYQIIDLKSMKLPELQEIALKLKIPKFRSYRKQELIYQILDYQAANPVAVKTSEDQKVQKPPQEDRKRHPRKDHSNKNQQNDKNTSRPDNQ